MKLRLTYRSHGLPVEIEVEGSALTPDSIGRVLGYILEPLEYWLDKTASRAIAVNQPQSTVDHAG